MAQFFVPVLTGGSNKMNVKSVEKQEKSKVELIIEVSGEEFEAAIDKVYKKQRGKIAVPVKFEKHSTYFILNQSSLSRNVT